MKIENPTSEQFQTVINNLKSVLPHADFENNVDMSITGLPASRLEICGTPLCLGGWYAVSKGVFCDEGVHDYDDGAYLMAIDLGFKDHICLAAWARRNPSLWGNEGGGAMFASKNALRKHRKDEVTLKTIINWWIAVHNRTHPDGDQLSEI